MHNLRNTKPYRRLAAYYTSIAAAEQAIDDVTAELTRLRQHGDIHTREYARLDLRRQRLALILTDLRQAYII